ncbi:MAG TPA: metallopeptidase family protein [Solirubrobacteraceae bacterium]|nr:metallopeptidase family protein [Solirubrobacteraceae bacterium]
MPGEPPTPRRILLSAAAALTVGFGVVSVISGFSDSMAVRLVQGIAVFAAGAVLIGGAVVLVMLRLADWKDPESEQDFERVVQRAEALAARGEWGADDGELELYDGDRERYDDDDEPLITEDEDFRALVRQAIDELPLEFHRALEHVAIVVSDEGGRVGPPGRQRRAYGLYQGDTVAHDFFHDRIIIFKDTLLHDFGHDPEMLRAQVTQTVRHELAHHLGWDEKGVRGLGL